MPIYEEEGRITREDLLDLRKKNVCKECGANLNMYLDPESGKAFVACWDWPRSHHEGIEREASRYEKEGVASLNIKTREEIMNKEYGKETTTALDKARLPMTGALTQPQAEHILSLVYPGVPRDERIRCAILCRDFGLHPLMKEVYIIGFKNKHTGEIDYSTVIGILASRKMAADRKGAYSFLDGTPRAATPEEIIQQYGKNSEEERDNLISICKLKGEKGNEATGFGLWPKGKEPYGTDKGNTKRNMANIRSERPAYSRLPGAALPPLEVIDEAYAEVPDVGKVDTKTGEVIEGEFTEVYDAAGNKIEGEREAAKSPADERAEHWCEEHNCAFVLKRSRYGQFYAHKTDDPKYPNGFCNEKKKEAAPAAAETDAGHTEAEPESGVEESQQPKRDPDTIKTLNDLYKACHEDFKLQPDQVIKELGVSSPTDIADTPADCYRQIAKVR